MFSGRRAQAQAPPTKEQKTTSMLKRMGVSNPQPRNMERNVMLSQIERFDRSGLKAKQDEQRYMVSPHKDVRNFMANSIGMGQQAVRDNHPVVRPVFKDDDQRSAFHDMAKERLDSLTKNNWLSTGNQQKKTALESLRDWSHSDSAMMNFENVDTKRSHPVVFVQGHGSPGDKKMYSDGHEAVGTKKVASMLNQMSLPKVSEVRVNSCFSGTKTDLSSMPNVDKRFQKQTIDQSAGAWGSTFAGSLDKHLNQASYSSRYQSHKAEVDKVMNRPLGRWGKIKAFFNGDNFTDARKKAIDQVSTRHNRVVGYLGPTTQTMTWSKNRDNLGKIGHQQHTAVVFGDKGNRNYFKHGDAARTGPSVKG